MAEDTEEKPAKVDDRADRLAAALRANLRKRNAQRRARRAGEVAVDDTSAPHRADDSSAEPG